MCDKVGIHIDFFFCLLVTWKNQTASGEIPNVRKHHSTTLLSDGYSLVVMAGDYFDSNGLHYILNDVWILDCRQYIWSRAPIVGSGLARSNHTSILIGDKIWVIAGTNLTARAVDMQVLNTENWTWMYDLSQPKSKSVVIPAVCGTIGGLLVIACGVGIWWFKKRKQKEELENQFQLDLSDQEFRPPPPRYNQSIVSEPMMEYHPVVHTHEVYMPPFLIE
ncbi:hypothetical protein BDB01DRAFT_480148 [Pilobolus umbonatus]|nr:hypothetical protein BDB01DRAFT_480148 [Pilobolus umbonatus]